MTGARKCRKPVPAAFEQSQKSDNRALFDLSTPREKTKAIPVKALQVRTKKWLNEHPRESGIMSTCCIIDRGIPLLDSECCLTENGVCPDSLVYQYWNCSG